MAATDLKVPCESENTPRWERHMCRFVRQGYDLCPDSLANTFVRKCGQGKKCEVCTKYDTSSATMTKAQCELCPGQYKCDELFRDTSHKLRHKILSFPTGQRNPAELE